ncbi:MAG: CoA ester lyase [Pseudomonadota bacterium]
MSRSYLFVPGDSERKLSKACNGDADALILDLEDAVAGPRKESARRLVAEFLNEPSRCDCWVRINALDSGDAKLDLEAIVGAAPYGIVLPKPRGAEDIVRLADWLSELEDRSGDGRGVTRILPIVTEHPAALFRLHEFAGASNRLEAMTWGAEDLSAAVGASRCRDADGRWLPPYELARSLCLFASAAAALPAVDTVFTDIRDTTGLAEYAQRARADGFSGMLAIHPNQIEVINEAFTPSQREIAAAAEIVRFFDDNPTAGVTEIGGKMVDRPHLLQARRVIELAARVDALSGKEG